MYNDRYTTMGKMWMCYRTRRAIKKQQENTQRGKVYLFMGTHWTGLWTLHNVGEVFGNLINSGCASGSERLHFNVRGDNSSPLE